MASFLLNGIDAKLSLLSTSKYNTCNIAYILKYMYNEIYMASLIAQSVKNLPAMQETWVRFLGQEDLLKKKMAIHSSILAWKTLWTEGPGRLQSMGSQESDKTQRYMYMCKPSLKYMYIIYVCVLSCFNYAYLLETLQTVAHQAPLPMVFSRQE